MEKELLLEEVRDELIKIKSKLKNQDCDGILDLVEEAIYLIDTTD